MIQLEEKIFFFKFADANFVNGFDGTLNVWDNFTEICIFVVVVALLFYVHSKHVRSCRDGQLT